MGMLLSSSIRKPYNTKFQGEDHDERIKYIFRRSFITNFGWIFITGVMLFTPSFMSILFASSLLQDTPSLSSRTSLILILFWYLVTFGFAFQNFINWFFNVYIITNKKIIDMDFHGMLSKNISEASLKNVEDVTSNVTGTLRIAFNFGHVYIQTSAKQREFDFVDVSNPSKVRDIVADLAMEIKNGS